MMYDGETCAPALPWEPVIYAASARADRLLELLSGMRGNYCPVRRMNYCPVSYGIIVRYPMIRLLMGRGPTATRHIRERNGLRAVSKVTPPGHIRLFREQFWEFGGS